MSFASSTIATPLVKLPLRILCVDDDKSVRTYFRTTLSTIVEHVIEAENGEQGYELFLREKPDITLIDVQMPHVNGVDLARRIRDVDPHHAIIVCSVMQDSQTFVSFIEIGVDSYLVKPVRAQQLFGAVQQCAEKVFEHRKHLAESERQQASLEAFYQMFENTTEAVVIVSARSRTILAVNSIICSILHLTRDELIGKNADDFFVQSNLRWIKVLRMNMNPIVYEGEVEITKQDGTKIIFEGRSVEFYNKLGELCIGIIAYDITAQKVMMEKLLQNEKHYRALVSNVPGALYTCDVMQDQYTVRFVSDFVEIITGYPTTEFIGNNGMFYRSLVVEEHREKMESAIQYGIATAGSFEIEYEIIDKDQQRKWIAERAQAITNDLGAVVSIDGVFFDITKRKQVEEKLQLFNDELQASQAKLQELNASKDKFFSIVSHDLRSPFNGIIGSTEVLMNSIEVMDTSDIKDGVRDVYKTLKALYDFIENLLTWSRSQTKGLSYSPVEIQLYEIVQAVTFLLKENTAKKSIVVEVSVSSDILVYADYNMLRSVVHNLFSNAIKFTPASGTICINADVMEQKAMVSVSDSGVGMSEQTLEKLFRIDVNHTTLGTNNEKGTGLGLILCKEMVERNGGKITVQSKEGKGSVFAFSVPLSQSIEKEE